MEYSEYIQKVLAKWEDIKSGKSLSANIDEEKMVDSYQMLVGSVVCTALIFDLFHPLKGDAIHIQLSFCHKPKLFENSDFLARLKKKNTECIFSEEHKSVIQHRLRIDAIYMHDESKTNRFITIPVSIIDEDISYRHSMLFCIDSVEQSWSLIDSNGLTPIRYDHAPIETFEVIKFLHNTALVLCKNLDLPCVLKPNLDTIQYHFHSVPKPLDGCCAAWTLFVAIILNCIPRSKSENVNSILSDLHAMKDDQRKEMIQFVISEIPSL